MTACPTLVTQRLLLRPLEESDLDAYTDARQPDGAEALRAAGTLTRARRRRRHGPVARPVGVARLRASSAVAERPAGHSSAGRPAPSRAPTGPGWRSAGRCTRHAEIGYATEAGGASLGLCLRGDRRGRGPSASSFPRTSGLRPSADRMGAHPPRRAGAHQLSGDRARHLEARDRLVGVPGVEPTAGTVPAGDRRASPVDQHDLAGDIGRAGQAEDHLGHVARG